MSKECESGTNKAATKNTEKNKMYFIQQIHELKKGAESVLILYGFVVRHCDAFFCCERVFVVSADRFVCRVSLRTFDELAVLADAIKDNSTCLDFGILFAASKF